jgi:hypothetical protein
LAMYGKDQIVACMLDALVVQTPVPKLFKGKGKDNKIELKLYLVLLNNYAICVFKEYSEQIIHFSLQFLVQVHNAEDLKRKASTARLGKHIQNVDRLARRARCWSTKR